MSAPNSFCDRTALICTWPMVVGLRVSVVVLGQGAADLGTSGRQQRPRRGRHRYRRVGSVWTNLLGQSHKALTQGGSNGSQTSPATTVADENENGLHR